MAARYGDAGEESQQASYEDNKLSYATAKRRLTQQYGQAATTRARLGSSSLHPPVTFREFTRESLANIGKRRLARVKRPSAAHLEPGKARLEPDPYLASGQQLPPALVRQMPTEMVGKPIEDIDPFYSDQEVGVEAGLRASAN